MSEHKPLYLKQVGFVGRFKGGSKPLKDLVFLADGAPVDDLAIFTNYIVIGEGGENTQAYKKVANGIQKGFNIALTPEQLHDIVDGRMELPVPAPQDISNRIVYSTPEAEANIRQNELFLWQSKRDMYIERYGVPIGDNARFKMNVRAVKAMQKALETKIISISDNPEYFDRAVDYLSAKWNIPRVVYQNCVSNSMATESPLPRWYLLVNTLGDIIGCYGLITNDFISRQDLWPWVCALYIEKGWRGHKFGSKLLEHGRLEAKRLGFGKLYLSTAHIGYYEKYGWRYIGDGYDAGGQPSRIYEIDTE